MPQTQKVSGRSTWVFNDGTYNVVQYQATPVVRWNDDEIILNTGGWMSMTTRTRMNQASHQFDLDFTVNQENHEWFVYYKGKKIPFISDELVLKR